MYVDHQGVFGVLIFPDIRGSTSGFTTAGGFDETPIQPEVGQVESYDAVGEFQTDPFQLLEDSCLGPLVPSGAQSGC